MQKSIKYTNSIRMKTLYIFLFSISYLSVSFGQLLLTGPDFPQANPLNCAAIIPPAGGTNFSDGPANYLPNMDEIITFCPDLSQGSKVSIAFATNIGFTFNVDASDTLYVFDGPSIASPLLGAYNSSTHPNGFFVQASFQNNPSGCLTLRFKSNGIAEGTGWDANVACGNPQQPFVPHMHAYVNGTGPDALNPADTGYVDVCFGDSILFVADPTFPYALEVTNTGYSQNAGNCSYQWTIGGVGQFNNDSIWFTPPARAGYFIDLRITDIFPQIKRITAKVRVSQLPSFAGTGPFQDTVCLGENTFLIGGVTPQDTVGVDIPFGEFEIGGVFAGLTFLPDGSGVQYQTNIGITGFDDTTTITGAADFDQMCIDIEHSYIGDLEIALTCPNGTTVSILNAYNSGFGVELVPGGCGSGIGTFLGNDTNLDGGAPGSPVWSYCFSPTQATLGTICTENAAGNTVINAYGFPSMDPNGVYLPDGDFNNFIGCPVNGNWTITVQDNQGIDDGYIFQWGIYFNQSLYPDQEGYQNTIISDNWTNSPSIISGQNDTAIIIQPITPGTSFYTYNVVDDFGCNYDTTVTLEVLPLPVIFSDTLTCNLFLQVSGTSSYSGGIWTASDTAVSFSNSALENPLISTSIPGIYSVTFTDNACNNSLSANIEFPPYVYVDILDSSICNGATIDLVAASINSGTMQGGYNPPIQLTWNNGSTDNFIVVNAAGQYYITANNACHTSTDTSTVTIKPCDIEVPNIITLNSLVGNNLFTIDHEGVVEFECVILNRWGNVIYTFTDPTGSWDGKTEDGKLVEEGTYFYRIFATFDGGIEIKKHGFVYVTY
ncbi:MAG: gliding motility-associated C-terminal domain-containing protein [Crocinitomicaceae bacterium]|nr:gliding motility-associated C-terminal domain-containing protein [Crocinitomicaceae bacterium]